MSDETLRDRSALGRLCSLGVLGMLIGRRR
jgi:hypothetical protein